MGAHAAANLESVDTGQHHIQNDRIEVGAFFRRKASFAVAADLDLIAARTQILAQHFYEAGIVVDEKYAHWHDKRWPNRWENSRSGLVGRMG
jgi:hypothetical protein